MVRAHRPPISFTPFRVSKPRGCSLHEGALCAEHPPFRSLELSFFSREVMDSNSSLRVLCARRKNVPLAPLFEPSREVNSCDQTFDRKPQIFDLSPMKSPFLRMPQRMLMDGATRRAVTRRRPHPVRGQTPRVTRHAHHGPTRASVYFRQKYTRASVTNA